MRYPYLHEHLSTCEVLWACILSGMRRATDDKIVQAAAFEIANNALTRGFSGAGGFGPPTPSLRKMWSKPADQGF